MNEHSKHSGVVVDGLLVSELTRDLFEQMQRGGLTLAHYTCSVWENFEATMQRIASCKKLFEDNSDLVVQVYSVDDIVLAKQSNRVGIALGWQNTAGIEDKLDTSKNLPIPAVS